MKPLSAILVDLDGTLADTAAANYAAYAAALGEHGLSISPDRFTAIAFGRNWRQFLPPLLEEAGSLADPSLIAARKGELYATMLDRIVVNSGLVRLLELSRTCCRTGLVTTASGANTAAVLAHHDLARLFDVVITGSDVSAHKPDPEAYHLAARKLGVLPQECLIFEDSDIGLQSAREFGASAIRVVIDPIPGGGV